jgi:CRISPR/Cas system CMR subunit Cmr6 (Cas7 group RAMP superfamily)
MAKMGRPKLQLDDKTFDTAIQLPLIKADIAKLMMCSEDTLDRYVKQRFGETFAVLQDKNRQHFRKNIIAKQYELAMKGNTTLLIWLGKQYCDQKDKTEFSGDASAPVQIAYIPKSQREQK